MTRIYAILAGAVLLCLLAGLWLFTLGRGGDDRFAQCRSSAIAGGTDAIGGPFTLVDETGATVTDTQVIDEPALIYFGYTFCPDVCPLDAQRNAQAVTLLEERGMSVKPVFITIDPKRDTPERLAEFTDYMHPDMVGLTGSDEQIAAASRAYRTYYKAQPPEDGDEDYYLVDHSTFTYLSLPETGFADYFRRDTTPEEMADRVACFLQVQ
ncbi:SCO family protein [Pseudooceanicola sp. C21-150M6]|uniref:SCO family protein n=1 Tax=Pseudooceanicola sp. C21-150M6 TaxID=3434355 RepID=UPI003D7FA480